MGTMALHLVSLIAGKKVNHALTGCYAVLAVIALLHVFGLPKDCGLARTLVITLLDLLMVGGVLFIAQRFHQARIRLLQSGLEGVSKRIVDGWDPHDRGLTNGENLISAESLLALIDRAKADRDTLIETCEHKITGLNNLVSVTRQEIQDVKATAGRLQKLNEKYYHSTFSLSSNLDDVTKDMNAFASHINSIADSTTRADQFAREMDAATVNGSERMGEMMAAIATISESSRQISDLIKTIDDIASKTNLLSLNATIEANRAGVHGRTFAVVAQEVRDLAIQSRGAVKESRELVGTTVSNLDAGSKISKTAMAALDGIREEVDRVIAIIRDIAQSAREQAEAVSRFNQNLA